MSGNGGLKRPSLLHAQPMAHQPAAEPLQRLDHRVDMPGRSQDDYGRASLRHLPADLVKECAAQPRGRAVLGHATGQAPSDQTRSEPGRSEKQAS